MGPGRIVRQPAQVSLFGMFLQKVGLGNVQRWLAACSRDFFKKMALLVTQTFGGWPPRPDFFRKRGYYIVAFLFGPLVVEGLYSYFLKPERQKSWYIERETKKRMRTLCEIINDENLHLMETVETSDHEGEKATLGRAGGSDVDGSTSESGCDSENEEESVASDKHTKVDSMVCAIEDVEEIDEEVAEIREAYVVAARMIKREMGEALEKTMAQKDEKFKDGEKLRELMYTAEWLQIRLIGTPFEFSEFCRMPSKFLFGEDRQAFTANNDETKMFQTAYSRHLKDVKDRANRYIRETESTWLKKAVYILLRFKQEIPLICAGNMFAIAHGALGSLSSLYESELINSIQQSIMGTTNALKMQRGVKDIVIAMLLAHLIETATELYSEKLNSVSQSRMGTKLQQDVFHHILQQDIEYWDVHESYEAMHYVSSAKNCLFWLLDAPSRLLEKCSSIAMTSIVLFNKSPALFGILMASRVLQISIRSIVLQYSNRIRRKLKKGNVTKSNNIYELLNPRNFRTLRSFTREPIEHEEFVEQSNMNDRAHQRLRIIDNLSNPIFSILNRGPEIFALYYGGSLVANGKLEAGDLLQFVHLGLNCVHEVSSIVNDFGEDMYNSLEPVAKIYDLLERRPKIGLYGGNELQSVVGEVKVENVHFSYPTRPGSKVLRGVGFTADAGKLTALVGPSGSGKTTIMSMIERFYDPKTGSISIDGIDIKDIKPISLRRQIAIVPQEPVLFNRSIRENMVYGCQGQEPSQEAIERAAKDANIYDFIVNKCPEKWRTEVGRDGVRLSGGQKQRLAIARAILMEPKILLLDEATSALDQESESLVQEALERLMKGKTTIAIAHRLSTIKNAAKIVCIENGKVCEEGTHKELMNGDGLYCRYWREQSGANKEHKVGASPSKDVKKKKVVSGEAQPLVDKSGAMGTGNENVKFDRERSFLPKVPKTPPRSSTKENQNLKDMFEKLQNTYNFFLPKAQNGDVIAIEELCKVFNDLGGLLGTTTRNISSHSQNLTFSEPRPLKRQHSVDGSTTPFGVSIALRRTKSYKSYESSREVPSARKRPSKRLQPPNFE